MEESCEVHPEEDKVLPEKGKKRKLKTPSQLEALEKFYNEHRYPSELMKAEFAQKLELSEKQISGWFCHRRLKDKRLLNDDICANGRQDLSSGVIQDRGSGLKQDSCSSNKQGNYRYSDLREVESRRFDGADYPASDQTYEKRSKFVPLEHHSGAQNTSSGSSSTSQERLFSPSQNPYHRENIGHSSRSSNNMLIAPKGVMNKVTTMGSGYLHLQHEMEHASITSVKRQLGRSFRIDGPPLGTDFQSPPPGAFGSSEKAQVHEQYYNADAVMQNSHRLPEVRKEPNTDVRYARYSHQIYPQGSHSERGHIKRTTSEFVRQERTSFSFVRRKPSFSNLNDHAPEDFNMDNMDESCSPGEAFAFSGTTNHFMRSKYGVDGVTPDSMTNHRPPPYGGKHLMGESSHSQLHSHDGARNHKIQRQGYSGTKSSSSVFQQREAFEPMDSMTKEEFFRTEKGVSKYANPTRLKKHLKNGLEAGKRARGDDMPRDYVPKTPYPKDQLPCRNQIKESPGNVVTSVSEDETAASDSSMD